MTSNRPRRTILLGLGGVALAGAARAQSANPFQVTPPGPDTPRPLPAERAIGSADAPVTVIEFHSLSCGNCARFHTEIFPRIKVAYIEPGLVRFVLRDFPLDRAALEGAAMAHCAGPEKFEPMLSTLYAAKESWAHSQDTRGALRRIGMMAGLAGERIDACWNDRGFTDPIIEMRLVAERQWGINATPSFVIGGQVHRGVLSFERFAELLRPLLPPGAQPRG